MTSTKPNSSVVCFSGGPGCVRLGDAARASRAHHDARPTRHETKSPPCIRPIKTFGLSAGLDRRVDGLAFAHGVFREGMRRLPAPAGYGHATKAPGSQPAGPLQCQDRAGARPPVLDLGVGARKPRIRMPRERSRGMDAPDRKTRADGGRSQTSRSRRPFLGAASRPPLP